jgi:hypothetical protein
VSSRTAAQLASDKIIKLGDYIDLEGGLTVDDVVGDSALLRLIVVGINSFNASTNLGGSSTGNPAYTGGNGSAENGNAAHVVFQFQNVAFSRQMNATETAENGYAGSAMRTYLINAFLTGLNAAGVPDESWIWAPKRYVANKAGSGASVTRTEDKLWLPTIWEMLGEQDRSENCETAANQARLEYYSTSDVRIKYKEYSNTAVYWLASPSRETVNHFCLVTHAGTTHISGADENFGVAPAFCVK